VLWAPPDGAAAVVGAAVGLGRGLVVAGALVVGVGRVVAVRRGLVVAVALASGALAAWRTASREGAAAAGS
jgi:hypothetical protein